MYSLPEKLQACKLPTQPWVPRPADLCVGERAEAILQEPVVTQRGQPWLWLVAGWDRSLLSLGDSVLWPLGGHWCSSPRNASQGQRTLRFWALWLKKPRLRLVEFGIKTQDMIPSP